MKYVLSILTILFLNPLALADEKSCFPVGSATHDRECYDFDTPESCMKKDDIYSCGWGKRSDDRPSDDDVLICETQRCPNAIDDVEDLEEE